MEDFIDVSTGQNPRLKVVWTAQDAVDALAAGVCDCDPVFSSTAAREDNRIKNTRKHTQRFHEDALVDYLRDRILDQNIPYVSSSCFTVCSGLF